jgi:hypothetical protein
MSLRHEPADLSPVRAAIFAGALVILISTVLALAFEVYRLFEDRATVPLSKFETTIQSFPEPRLQVSPHSDLLQLQEREQKMLESYAWIDREHRIARMPIDQAIAVALQNGLPQFSNESSRGEAK